MNGKGMEPFEPSKTGPVWSTQSPRLQRRFEVGHHRATQKCIPLALFGWDPLQGSAWGGEAP